MRIGRFSGQMAAVGVVLGLAIPLTSHPADARSHHAGSRHASAHQGGAHHAASHTRLASRHGRHGSVHYASAGGISCVPFARANSGIELSGNAATWWDHAEGVYQRGARPEVGSVLNFRANGRMHLGHVAVVSNVIDRRTIEIDHANWSGPGAHRGGVSRDINVVDVSPGNDWTAVRVELGHTEAFGSIYPTYGFIYDRPDQGTMIANNGVANAGAAPAPTLNPAPRDLRPAEDRMEVATAAQDVEEVAEAPDDSAPRVRRAGLHHRRSHVRVLKVHAAPGRHGGHSSRVHVMKVRASETVHKRHRHHT